MHISDAVLYLALSDKEILHEATFCLDGYCNREIYK